MSSSAWAADREGCKDIPGIKRYVGSQIFACSKRDFIDYHLPVGRDARWDDQIRRYVGQVEEVDGGYSRIQYETAVGTNSIEVFDHYKNDLTSSGFKILYEAKHGDAEKNRQLWSQEFRSGGDQRYAAAVKEVDGVKTYVALYVINISGEKARVALDQIVAGKNEREGR
jgi:hypothetical protein